MRARNWTLAVALLGVGLFAYGACAPVEEQPSEEDSCLQYDYSSYTPSTTAVSFKRDLEPVFRRSCAFNSCHSDWSSPLPKTGIILGVNTFATARAPFSTDACGDFFCDDAGGETATSCPFDCGTCGDGTCGLGEVGSDCPHARCDGGCGDKVCGAGETEASCAGDCTADDCGDGVCNLTENLTTCPADCEGTPCAADCAVTCGNHLCDGTETLTSCRTDCDTYLCGNGTCDDLESPTTCPFDCGTCGDGVCGKNCDGEGCENERPGTCADCAATCFDRVCDAGESAVTCPADCPADDAVLQRAWDSLMIQATPKISSNLCYDSANPGTAATGRHACIAPAEPLIKPGDPEHSFFMIKVDGCQAKHGFECRAGDIEKDVKGCGARMPNSDPDVGVIPPLSKAERQLVRDWIAQGALYDGT